MPSRPRSRRGTRRLPLELDLELPLVALHLELDLDLNLFRDVELEVHAPALELDLLVIAGEHVGQAAKPGGDLLAGQRLLLLHFEDVHRFSFLRVVGPAKSGVARERYEAGWRSP